MKESLCITLPTHISKENNHTACIQTVQPALGFTLAETCRAQNEPTLTIPQLLEIEPCKDYTETPLQTLDGLYVTQSKRFLPHTQEVKKLAEGVAQRRNSISMGWTPTRKTIAGVIHTATRCPPKP